MATAVLASEPTVATDDGREDTAAWTTQDVIDPRIDEFAQYALMRMLTNGGVEGIVASNILSAVKAGDLGGVYLPAQGVPARHARDQGKGYWQLLPAAAAQPRRDAVCVEGLPARATAAARPPLIVFRDSVKKQRALLDPALIMAWHECTLGTYPLRTYHKTLANKRPPGPPPPEEPPPGGVLGVQVISGREPRPDVLVDWSGTATAGGVTDGEGLVLFHDLAAGRYTATARPPGEAAVSAHVTVASGTVHAVVLVLGAGPTTPGWR